MTTNMICRVCNGTGNQTLTELDAPVTGVSQNKDGSLEVHLDETQKSGRTWEIPCVWCNGKGTMTKDQLDLWVWNQTAWCECEHRSGIHYYRHKNGAHGWKCNDCNKLVQTG